MTLSTADRLEILDVIARADWAATRRDADAYVQLFTEDAVLDGDQGHHAGREAAGSWRIARRTVGAPGRE
jgi:ketosteroid isomerase-like protein